MTTPEEYADALSPAIEALEWALLGMDPDDENHAQYVKSVQVLRYLYSWHVGTEYPTELRLAKEE